MPQLTPLIQFGLGSDSTGSLVASGGTSISSSIGIIIGVLVALVLFVVVGVIVTKRVVKSIREDNMKADGLEVILFEVKVPQSNEIEIKAAEQMFSGLLGIGKKLKWWQKHFYGRIFVSFEIVAYKEQITFYVACPKRLATLVDRQINGSYPTAQISPVKEYNIFSDSGKVAYASLKLDDKNYVPVNTYDAMSVDTIATLTDVMSKLQEGEASWFPIDYLPGRTDLAQGW